MDDDILPDNSDFHLEEVAHLYHKDALATADAFIDEHDPDDDPFENEKDPKRRLRGQKRRFDPYNPNMLEKLSGAFSKTWERKRRKDEFDPSKPVRVRVLDVDRLELDDVHRHFMFTLTRRLPAEHCMKVASRVGQFRDKQTHQSYENLIRDCGRVFGPTHGPELVALFSRCYATISVPYMVDYTRRYGQFSKNYIASLIEKSEQPRLFDFMRYEHCGGAKPLPGILKEPYALASYTRLLAKCSAKQYMFQELQKHGHLPKSMLERAAVSWDELELTDRIKERISANEDPMRPAIMDKIIEREHARAAGIEIKDSDDEEDEDENSGVEHQFAMQFQRVAQEPQEAAADERDEDDEPMDALVPEGPAERWWRAPRERFRYKGNEYALIEGGWQKLGSTPRRRRKYRSHKDIREKKEEKLMKRAEAMSILEQRYRAKDD